MNALSRRPSQPKGADDEERACDTCQWQSAHFFLLRPRAVEALGAGEVPVPGEVDCGRYDGADADRKECEARLTGVEVVDALEDYGV